MMGKKTRALLDHCRGRIPGSNPRSWSGSNFQTRIGPYITRSTEIRLTSVTVSTIEAVIIPDFGLALPAWIGPKSFIAVQFVAHLLAKAGPRRGRWIATRLR